VQNLLSNAAEYTPPDGWIELTCEVRESDIAITVADSGPGISDELINHVFEPFVRGDHPRTAAAEGHLGLGLSIVQANVRTLGGRCEVKNAVGAGAVFTVYLPATLLARLKSQKMAMK